MEEYYQELEEIALGWLGWSPDQTLYADVNAIIIGYYGRNKMLQVMQGLDPNAPQPSKPNGSVKSLPSSDKLPPLTPEAFDRMFPGKPAKRTRPSKGK